MLTAVISTSLVVVSNAKNEGNVVLQLKSSAGSSWPAHSSFTNTVLYFEGGHLKVLTFFVCSPYFMYVSVSGDAEEDFFMNEWTVHKSKVTTVVVFVVSLSWSCVLCSPDPVLATSFSLFIISPAKKRRRGWSTKILDPEVSLELPSPDLEGEIHTICVLWCWPSSLGLQVSFLVHSCLPSYILDTYSLLLYVIERSGVVKKTGS